MYLDMYILDAPTPVFVYDHSWNLQWYGAFALAMVLSLASAIPIVYICQLPKCGRRA